MNVYRKSITFVGLTAFLFSAHVYGQSWEAVDDPQALKALFSDTVIEATLESGVDTVARYNRDGTGELEAWGDTFPRSWEVRSGGQVCIGISDDMTCYTIERNMDAPQQYRAKNLLTGGTFEMTVEGNTIKSAQDVPSEDSGGAAQPSAEEMAAELANPNTPLATLTFKLQYRTFEGNLPGADDQDSTTLLFQPSFPFPRANGDVIFFRPAIPLSIDQPVLNPSKGGFDSEAGIGDIGFDLAYGRTTKNGILFAGGMVGSLPSATYDGLGNERLSLGPELFIGKLTRKYVIGAFPSHLWDVGGWGQSDVSLTACQFFATYLPGDGWSLGTAPKISFNHEINDWTVPLNFNIGKTIIAGGRPWKLGLEINYYVERPDSFGPEWFIGFSVAPVVKNIFAGWFK